MGPSEKQQRVGTRFCALSVSRRYRESALMLSGTELTVMQQSEGVGLLAVLHGAIREGTFAFVLLPPRWREPEAH